MSKIYMLLFFIISFFTISVQAQIDTKSELFITLQKNDSLMFEEVFNKCRLNVADSLTAADLEFYHDVGGMQNKAEFLKAMKDNICSDMDHKPIRKLIPGTLEVFELKNNGVLYGAIQMGTHQFYYKDKGKEPYLTGIAKFTSLWILENNNWKMKRVLSYDHHAAGNH